MQEFRRKAREFLKFDSHSTLYSGVEPPHVLLGLGVVPACDSELERYGLRDGSDEIDVSIQTIVAWRSGQVREDRKLLV